MEQRGLDSKPQKLTEEQKQQRWKEVVDQAQEEVNNSTSDNNRVEQSEVVVDDFMRSEFEEYVPLEHHLMKYEMTNIIKQYSKTTPESELSVFNLYLGGRAKRKRKWQKLTKE